MNVYTQGNSESGFTTYIAIVSGETVSLAMTISTGGSPINLSGYSLKCRINFPTPLDLNTDNSGITIVNAAAGSIILNISAAQTSAIESGVFDFDLWMKSGGGIETPLLVGKFSVTPNIAPVP